MKKVIRWIVMGLLLAVFLFSGISVAATLYRYKVSDQRYEDAAEKFVAVSGDRSYIEPKIGDGQEPAAEGAPEEDWELPPITVDFEGLSEVNSDIVGWIYGEDTLIDYPVVQGEDDDFYLHHSYDKTSSSSGAIFVEAANRPGFADANTIIYGHHMKNKSMFASLSYWGAQEYYEAHPVLWLLTPQQDYKIVLFAGYTTSATAETYTIFPEVGPQLEEYIMASAAQSDFVTTVEPGGKEHYVLLSTCAYNFDNARYVLHGILEPLHSAGGWLKEE